MWDAIAAALPATSPPRASLWQSLAFWRGLTLATGALAAACIGALIYLGNAPQQAPLIAAIDGGGHHHFVATLDTRSGSIAVVPAAFSADATRVPELWLIPADGKPRPLGLLRADRAVTITIPPALLRASQQQCRAGGVAGTARRFTHRPADRAGDRLGQAHAPVIAIVHL